ncbi:MAG: long-chain-fatty-acid--CoA ligase [Candidatus Eremiobacteraeota bacterium]|nr:long-chain-fatty-acid--CoA ligase [Candidatus Eremiobacteraeota bacterium]
MYRETRTAENGAAPNLIGLMMDRPLLISSILEHAQRWNAAVEIVTREGDGSISRSTYGELAARTARLAHALRAYGIAPGERVGTFAWNSQRHLELYYGVSGIGAVVHTVNPRLFAEQIEYIVNHARDRIVFVDADLVGILEPLASRLETVELYVVLGGHAGTPHTSLPNAVNYEAFIAGWPDSIAWPAFDERTASSLCYTSGTTGNPKGALYSHRSTVLHALSGAAAHRTRKGAISCVLPVVPMFHANAWGLPYVAPMVGAKLVMPGPRLDPASLYELFEHEAVDFTAGVPTVWLWLLAYLKAGGLKFTTLAALGVGGSASPRAMIEAFENDYGVEVLQGWGMTETSPVCTTGAIKAKHDTENERIAYKALAGRCNFGADMRLVDEDGRDLPFDGVAQGELLVRGHWVVSAYFEDEAATGRAFTEDGWFRTGDIASLDADGYLTMRDRTKDVIKSGGEWISSIDLENVAAGHPDVAEAAAIGVPHPTWAERPILAIGKKPETAPTRESVLAFLEGKIAKWWMPDDVVFVEDLPHTATGKVSKRLLRERFGTYRLPAPSAR